MELDNVGSSDQTILADSASSLEELYLAFPCKANTDLYRRLLAKSLPTLRKLSVSLQDETHYLELLLRTLETSQTLQVLKLNYTDINVEIIDSICTMPNLTVITGLKIG